ncbi:sulfatase-like hydrolase/transferase [Pontiellaceae bacterium B1224]|nr:sulfatase-like hydrolase/transferase [Pontiellaceae bacterium B1224]
MMKKCAASLTVLLVAAVAAVAAEKRPNVVLIYADDLGFGDVGCYNPDSRIPTPNIDALAQHGIRFIDAHAPDAICSPSRYGLLTGSYSWRTSIKEGNPKPGDQPWINEGRLTLPGMLKNLGYDTAVFGKWGLGADWAPAAKVDREGNDISAAGIDYSKPVFAGKPFGFSWEEVHLWYGKAYFEKKYPCHDVPGSQESVDGGRGIWSCAAFRTV